MDVSNFFLGKRTKQNSLVFSASCVKFIPFNENKTKQKPMSKKKEKMTKTSMKLNEGNFFFE